jgi:hypothetical protein
MSGTLVGIGVAQSIPLVARSIPLEIVSTFSHHLQLPPEHIVIAE